MQAEVSKWRSWIQLAGPNLFIRSKWHTAERNVAVGDVVWLCDQNAKRGQVRLGRVVSTNPDSKGIMRDVNVRVIPSYSIPLVRAVGTRKSEIDKQKEATQATVLHRDVWLVVLLPVEEQGGHRWWLVFV